MASEQRYLAAQEVVLTLQRNLLPAAVPVVPGVRCAAQYVVAEAELQAGGDWFDTVPVGDGRVALVVGDVVGHGATAAAAMSQLRPVLREALRSGAAPAEAVDRLDAFAADSPATRAATVERPDEPADEGAARLARIVTSAMTTRSPADPEHAPDRLCALSVERVTRSGYVDDITVLAAQRSASPVAPLVVDVAAEAVALVLDLEQVAFLASAGVQLLHELLQDDRAQLSAPAGTPARQVLDLTELSTRTAAG